MGRAQNIHYYCFQKDDANCLEKPALGLIMVVELKNDFMILSLTSLCLYSHKDIHLLS